MAFLVNEPDGQGRTLRPQASFSVLARAFTNPAINYCRFPITYLILFDTLRVKTTEILNSATDL